MRTIITGGTVVTPDQTLPAHTVLIEDGRIAAFIPPADSQPPADQVIDAAGQWVTPGLIDVHVHGGAGYDVMDAIPDALRSIEEFFASHGVTGYLPTTMSTPGEAISAAVENIVRAPQPERGSQRLGIHLEGPYLSPEFKGAQPVSNLRDADPAEYTPWLDTNFVRLITLAPEREGSMALIDEGARRGIEFAVGHSNAIYDQVVAAADRGLRQATHTFNGMLGLHHREPGTVGAVLTDDRIYPQVIPDGIHLHPAIVKLIVRAKGLARTILITDSMRAAGMPDGEYDLGGQTIQVSGGIARTASGSLAGSTLTMDQAVRNTMQFAEISFQEAITMATSTPALAMGWEHKGTLYPGKDADLVVWDRDLNVTLTMVGGAVVYRADSQ